MAKVAEEEVTAPVSSMRLLHESLPNGELLVCQRRSDGALVPVFRGTLGEWMAWTPPELLRDESRLAEMLALGKLTGAARRDGEAERETRRRAG